VERGELGRLLEWFSNSASVDRDRGFSGLDASDTEEIYLQDTGGLSEADADGGPVDSGLLHIGDEHSEGVDSLGFMIRGESVCHDSE
jgi:hypothetical protein